MSEIVFFVPPAVEHAGGGSAYNRHLIAGLHDLNAAARSVVVGDAESAVQAWQRLPAAALGVIDGMVLPLFDQGTDRPPILDQRASAIVHHPTALADPVRRVSIREAECRLMSRLARVIATSEAVGARLVAEFGVDTNRIRVVPPGLGKLARSEGSAGPVCHVLAVGRLAPRKGHDVLIHALACLRDLDWRLTIAGDSHGDPACMAMLQALAGELGVACRLTAMEQPDAAALESLWRTADLFALASRRETTGIAIAEALRRGLPVAATACEALVPHEAGVVCAPEDMATLSKCLRRMIFDRAVRRQMADAAWAAGQALPGWPRQAALFLTALDATGPRT